MEIHLFKKKNITNARVNKNKITKQYFLVPIERILCCSTKVILFKKINSKENAFLLYFLLSCHAFNETK